MTRCVLASDFHLSPADPRGIEVFTRFCAEVVRGAAVFYVLGDLFESWVGRKQLAVPGHAPVFEALAALSAAGTRIVLFHGNRDFLLGRVEGALAGGEVVGEEAVVEHFGRRYLLLHGDSLCTLDIGYQRTKPILRSWLVRGLSATLPLAAQQRIAGGLRGTSRRTVSAKPREVMEIVGDAVRSRFAEGHAALICGHVHAPGLRDYGDPTRPLPVYVLGDWHEGGVFATLSADGVALQRFEPGLALPAPAP